MSLNNFGLRYFLFLFFAVVFATRGQASTITVVPSEALNQIQASINNSHAGDTISFQAGTFNISNVRLLPGRTYLGATSGQTILHGSGGSALMVFYGSGLTLQHITFDGGGLYLGGAVSNVHLEYNTFQNISFGPNASQEWGNWPATDAIHVDSSITSSDISYNTFHNLDTQIMQQYVDWNLGVTGIFGYNLNSTTITYNTFDTVNEGIHFFSSTNSQVEHNTLIRFHRIGMEFQNTTSNLDLGYNSFSQPVVPFFATFGISAAITGGNATIHDNFIDDQVDKTCGSGCWIGYGVEAWGAGTVVTRNTIQGHWGNGVAIGPSSNLQVTNNKICGLEMSQSGNGFVVNQDNTRWTGEVMAPNVTSSALVCQ